MIVKYEMYEHSLVTVEQHIRRLIVYSLIPFV